MTVYFADSHHQLGVQIATFSGKEVEQCISNEGYFHRKNNQLTILSVNAECNNQLIQVIQYAKTVPEDLRVRVINVAENYKEAMLQRPYQLCDVSIANDVNEDTMKWLLFDCNESKKKGSTKSKIKWLIISIITAVTVIIVVAIAAYYYCIKGKRQKNRKQEEQEHEQRQQQNQQTSLKTSSGKLYEVTDRTTQASASTTQITDSSDSKLIRNIYQTKGKVRTKQNKLQDINERINRQADEEFKQVKKELIAFYKQVRQCFPEKTEKTQQQSEKNLASEEDNSSSLSRS
ncbi:Uncharacterized protein BM_BM17687 [Brugia malayi]|uniref:Uncharacterized protein n=2 Tax=Brugia TaxID=6278 RepID=A0A4E9FJX0_BRUMA|nr:Uncharacterized protein BM_BM17687 [Brugia malayi]VIO97311.1 Uncharacterized protein BM_BM17687 [Brugia malayi]